MAVLKTTNIQGALCVNGVAVGGSKDHKFCCFTASTTFTPSQDLVDGNASVAADIIGGGGGGGAWGLADSCSPQIYCIIQNKLPGRAGFLQDHNLKINSTNACAVTIGAGGVSGSLEWSDSAKAWLAGNSGVCTVQQATGSWRAGGAGGNSSLGSACIAYGGIGGGVFAMSCHQSNSECLCLAAPASPNPAYDHNLFGGNVMNICATSTPATGRCGCFSGSAPFDLQLGLDCNYGKVGFDGIACAIGQNSTQYGSPAYGYQNCFGSQQSVSGFGCRGQFNLNESNKLGYTKLCGNPGNGFCICLRSNDCGACGPSLASGSYSAGSKGIVVIHWDE